MIVERFLSEPRPLADLLSDGRRAFRQMRRQPAFTAIVLTALGLGIGASVALTSVVNSLLVQPLPYANDARTYLFWQDHSWNAEEYDFLRQRLGVFDELALFSTDGATYATSTQSNDAGSILQLVVSTPTLFDVVGARPLLGRLYDANDAKPGAAPVVVLSYALWQSDFGADPAVIGRQIPLDGAPTTVIGIMPRAFFFPSPDRRAWRPLVIDPSKPDYQARYLTIVARARTGATAAQVDAEMQRLARALGGEFSYAAAWDHAHNPQAIPARAYTFGKVREPLLLLLGAVGLLLLIACANAAALILARTTDRAGEMAVRRALGAGAGRLARQVFAESLVLALCGAAIGTLVATSTFRVLVARLPLGNDLGVVAAIGGTTFVIAFVLALLIALVVAIVPMRRLLRGAGGSVSRERSERGLHRGARRVHTAIITCQVAFAVLLVVGATLLIRSVARIRDVNLGFTTRGVTALTVMAGSDIQAPIHAQLIRQLERRVGALPGIIDVGVTNRLPVRDLGYSVGVAIEGRPDLAGDKRPAALYRTATPGLFSAMQMRFIAGHGFDSTDAAGGQPVAVVSEAFANAMWPGESAIGRHVTEAWSGEPIARTVIGVVRDVRLAGPTTQPPIALWVPYAQAGTGQTATVFVIRSQMPPATVVQATRRVVRETDARLAVGRTQTMDDAVNVALATPLRLRFFFTVFAALAMTLGAVGVFGLVSYAVARRRAECAVRMALGASPATIRREVLTFGLTPVVAGVAIGCLVAVAGARVLSGVLYGITPGDVPSFGAAAGMLLLAGLYASVVPAIRASRMNPADAMRADLGSGGTPS